MSPGWKLQCFGTFRLEAPDGQSVAINQRKVEGLLAILSYHRKSGVSRDEAGEILWPQKSMQSRRDNLKQVLSVLRKIVGATAIEATRERLKLCEAFDLSSDIDSAERRTGRLFMPLQEGEWFDTVRIEFEVGDDSGETATTGLLRMLHYYSHSSPRTTYRIMRDAAGLVRGLPQSSTLEIVERIGCVPGFEDWQAYWLAGAKLWESEVDHSRAWSRAIQLARSNNHHELAGRAAMGAISNCLLRGRLDEAESLAAETAEGPGPSRAEGVRARGLVLLHRGKFQAAFQDLDRIDELADPDDVNSAQTVNAYLLATIGDFRGASDRLGQVRNWVTGSGHEAAARIYRLTEAALLSASGRHEDSASLLNCFRQPSFSESHPTLAIYGLEARAVALNSMGERGMAEQQWAGATRIRSKLRLGYTPWDRARVVAKEA